MATTLSELSIIVRAKADSISADISRGIQKAQGNFQAQGKIIGTALAAGITAGMAGLVVAFKSGVKQIDDLSAAAQKIGVSTSGLAELQLAAKLTDSSFESLTAGIARMTANIATGKAGGALAKLKLDAEALRKLAPEEQFKQIAAALGQITDKGAQLAIGKEIFGKGVLEFVNLLEAGGMEMENIARIANVIGLTVSEKMVKSVNEFDNATHIMKGVWDGFSRQLAGQIAPLMKGLSEMIVDQLESWGGMAAVVQTVVQKIQLVGHTIAFAMHKADEMRFAIGQWATDGIAKALGGVADLTRALGKMVETTISGFRNLTNEMVGGIETTINATKVARLGLPKWLGGVDSVTPTTLPRVPEASGHSAALFGQGAEQIDDAKKSLQGLNLELEVHKDIARLSAQEVANLMTQQEEQNKILLADTSKAVQTTTKDIVDVNKKAAKEMQVRRAELVRETEGAFSQMQSANRAVVTDMVSAWITGTGKMSDIINQWAQQSLKRIIDVLLFGTKGGAGGAGGFGGVLGALGGMGGGWGGAIGSVAGALFGGARQSGGPVAVGRSYVVGERGPEMFMPKQSGNIMPSGIRGSGGATIFAPMITQNFAPGVSRVELAVIADQLQRETIAAVAATYEQGGSYRRRMKG